MDRWFAVLIAIDQLFNALVNASPDETFSAACHRKALKGKRRWKFMEGFINAMFFWDKEKREEGVVRHCHLSFESELSRKHFPNEYVERT